MIGPFINTAGIVVGSLLGVVCSRGITPQYKDKINSVFSCISLGLGISMTAKANSLPPVIIAILAGTFVGEVCRIESNVMKTALWAVGLFQKRKKKQSADSGLPEQSFRDQFAVVTVLFCASTLGVLGPMHEAVSGDSGLLLIKALLDCFTAMIFAANIGGIIGVLALPQLSIQSGIFLLSAAVVPLISPAMMGNFSACGGIIMLGTAMRQFRLVEVPILNMLPGLLLVMPLTAVWATLFSS